MATLDVGIAVEQAQGDDALDESQVVERPATSGGPWARWELLAYAALLLAALSLRLWTWAHRRSIMTRAYMPSIAGTSAKGAATHTTR